jgi:hypothetical protein
MTDETLRVNHSFAPPMSLFSGRKNRTSARQSAEPRIGRHGRVLLEETTRPPDKRRELVRVDNEIDYVCYRGQHEHQVSHGVSPAPTC